MPDHFKKSKACHEKHVQRLTGQLKVCLAKQHAKMVEPEEGE